MQEFLSSSHAPFSIITAERTVLLHTDHHSPTVEKKKKTKTASLLRVDRFTLLLSTEALTLMFNCYSSCDYDNNNMDTVKKTTGEEHSDFRAS